MADKGRPLPKFGEWDVNDPATAEGFTAIFNQARDEKKTGGKPESTGKTELNNKPGGPELIHTKSRPKWWMCCVQTPDAQS
ncbi:hypothetical protein Nepgr_026213 [Nepenthes gracilis]|uniref:RIN4 pathogenic type III effector avirulence factor Avr cleavage site domain-containing protein n=1 Tax=Nepenthes gracilis TaxID=150966 RepID=A0AAD3T7I7_NEPGR|nr:hypothetical protein Nepgr_026213 [Nepenthes gracilis]